MAYWYRLLCVAALAVLLSAVWTPVPAFAHAALVSSVPVKNGAAVEPVLEIVLTFSEAVKLVGFKLTDKDGREVVGIGEARADGKTLHVPFAKPLGIGRYTVNYRAVSADTHVVNGTFVFSVQGPST